MLTKDTVQQVTDQVFVITQKIVSKSKRLKHATGFVIRIIPLATVFRIDFHRVPGMRDLNVDIPFSALEDPETWVDNWSEADIME